MADAVFYARNPGERAALAGTEATIIGCGSFGSALADMLTRAGIGKLTLVDPELFSIENVGRHVLTPKDVGRPKVEALAERLREINPALEVDSRHERFRDGRGLLVCCTDSRRCESMVNGVSLSRGLTAVYAAAYGAVRAGEVQIVIPGKTACRECFAQFRDVDDSPPPRERYTDPDYDETRVPGQTGLWGSVLAVSGIAFHAILGVLGIRGSIDIERPLWFVNLDYAGFQPFAVTLGRLAKGCAVCDESQVAGLTL